MTIEIILPEMGEGIIEGRLARWLVSEGDQIEAFDPLAEIETDKVTTEITSENAGTILRLHVAEGQTVPVGTVLTEIAAEDEEPQAGTQTNGHNGRHAPAILPQEEPYTGRISPLVGRIAAENDVDLNQVQGTGLHGRITKQDILAYLEQEPASALDSQTTTIPAAPAELPSSSPSNQTKTVCPHRPGRRRTAPAQRHSSRHCRAHGAQQADQPPCDDGL